ncbi:MAG: hypothetical protein JXR96_25575 [Deltaproteobacteria bacterium]|nr:hypothetical protein [Deltaproteobacteria bacterium]
MSETSAQKTASAERSRAARWHWTAAACTALVLCALRIGPAFTPDEGTERVFLGFAYSIEDSLQYADFVAQARDGRLLLSNRFTLEAEEPHLVILPLYACGRVADYLGLRVASAWAGLQAVCVLAFVLLWYWFLGALFARPGQRLFAFFFTLLAGGLDGWVVLAGDAWPESWAAVLKRDLWTVLGWTPYMTMYNPLYLAGWICSLPALRLLLAALDGRRSAGLLLALGLPLVYLVHAYDAVVLTATALAACLHPLLVGLSGRELGRVCRSAAWAFWGLPAVVVLALWSAQDPVLSRAAAASHSGRFVSPVMWLLGFGGIALAAAYGVRRLGEPNARARLLFGWLAASALLSFSPIFEGRHFLYFVSLPLGVVAVDGLLWLRERLGPFSRRRLLWIAAAGALVFGSSFVRTTHRAFAHVQRDGRMYITPAELHAARHLRDLPEGGVLCTWETGSWLPHLSGKRAVMGHWFMTLRGAVKKAAFARLLHPDTSPAERDRLMIALGARYLFWGPREAALGPRPRCDRVQLLPLHRVGRVFVLEIRPPDSL